jgi:hypothetical protein
VERRLLLTVTCCLATVALVVAQRPAPKTGAQRAARAEQTVAFAVGETLAYDIAWSYYVTAGTATIGVREKQNAFGSQVYYVVAEGQPTPLISRLYPLHYKAETWLDSHVLLPHQGSIYSEEGRRKKTKITRFNQGARTATFEEQPSTAPPAKLRLQGPTHDAVSAFLALRSLPMKPGSTTIAVSDDGDVFKVKVTIEGRERVRWRLGTVDAWRLTPVLLDNGGESLTDAKLALWISDDTRRLPLKMEADMGLGAFTFTLRDVTGKPQ